MFKIVLTILASIAVGGVSIAGFLAVYDLFWGREERYREMHRKHLEQQSRVDERFSELSGDLLNQDNS